MIESISSIIKHKKRSIRSRKIRMFSMFSTVFPRFMPKDRIAHVDLRSFSKIDGVDSLSSIFENDRFDHFQDRIDLTILRSQKTIDSVGKPMIEFPTLNISTSMNSAFLTMTTKNNVVFTRLHVYP